MIKKQRISYGLDQRFAVINEFDVSGIFDIRMPLDFKSGKNEVKLKLLPNKLLKGSEVKIDIFDSLGNSIYYELSNLANEDESRSLIVFIYENTIPGKCKIYISGTLLNGKSYLCILEQNIVPSLETEQGIKFNNEPKVKYSERKLLTQNFTSLSRKISINGSGQISTLGSITPQQVKRDNFQIEKRELSSTEQVTSVNNNVGSGSIIEIPSYFTPSILTSNNFFFSSSMEGGTIFLNGINLEVPNDAILNTTFQNLSFSASIYKVKNSGSIEIYPPFNKLVEYETVNGSKKINFEKLINHSNFTASFQQTLEISNSTYSQSYAVFELSNLEPETGKIQEVEVFYKSLNQISSDYQSLGTYKVKDYNFLIDSASIYFKNPDGIIETPIGEFKSLIPFQNYWQTQSYGTGNPIVSLSNKVSNGIKLEYNPRTNTGSYFILEPKDQFKINVFGEDVNFKLEFESYSENDLNYVPQLDIYISGSEIENNVNNEIIHFTPLTNSNLGTYVGSISQNKGKVRSNEITFKVIEPGKILPKFVSRVGSWNLGNIKLKSNSERGFNSKQTKIYAPLSIPTGSELNFKIDYINTIGRKNSNYSTFINGVYFEGSQGPAITGGSTTIPPGTVSGSDQLTSSFDGRYERKGTGIVSSSNQIANDISGSFVQPSSSFSNRITLLEQKSGSFVGTGSYNLDSGSWNTRINDLVIKTGSYATTGSNQFNGNQSISGSLNVSSSITGRDFTGIFNGIPSSSQQIKNLLPTGTTSGSEQLTSSYDIRYERKGSGIFSSSQQIGPTGIYSGSGIVPYNTIVSASNLRMVTDNLDDFKSGIYFERGYSDTTNDTTIRSGSILILSGKSSTETRAYWEINDEDKVFKFGSFVPNGWHTDGEFNAGTFYLVAHTASFADDHVFEFGPNGITFSHGGTNKDGIKYGGDYSASLLGNPRSLPDIGTVRLMLTQSVSFLTSSFDSRYERTGNNIVSSSQQIKNLLPAGVSSGSEQFTSSYDLRYHKLGTGLISSSNQIANDISGSFTNLSSSFQSRISVFENKTLISGSEQLTGSYDQRYHRLGTGLFSSSQQVIFNQITNVPTTIFSSSQQVDYNSILNKPKVSGSGIYRLMISSGSDSSSSYADPRLTFDTSQSKFSVTASSTNISGLLYQTGSTSTRMSYIWDGPKTVGTTPGIVWTNMENASNTWLGTGGIFTNDSMYLGDFTEITQGRLFTALSTIAGGATCSLEVQYSLDGSSSWTPMVTLTVGYTPNLKDSGWQRVPDASKAFAYIRLVGWGGDGLRDPRFSPPIALFR